MKAFLWLTEGSGVYVCKVDDRQRVSLEKVSALRGSSLVGLMSVDNVKLFRILADPESGTGFGDEKEPVAAAGVRGGDHVIAIYGRSLHDFVKPAVLVATYAVEELAPTERTLEETHAAVQKLGDGFALHGHHGFRVYSDGTASLLLPGGELAEPAALDDIKLRKGLRLFRLVAEHE